MLAGAGGDGTEIMSPCRPLQQAYATAGGRQRRLQRWSWKFVVYAGIERTSTKATMNPEGSVRNSCNSWPLYTH